MIAHNSGFFKFIRLGEGTQKDPGLEYYKSLPKDELLNDERYLSWLEDCFEAFIGTTTMVIDDNHKLRGVSFEISYRIIKSFLDELKISLRYEDIFDAKTRYKEVCDKRWKFQGCVNTTTFKDDTGKTLHKTTVIGFPFNDQTARDENKKVLATITDKVKMESQNKACEQALDVLKNQYKIYDFPPDPYRKIN